MAADLRLCACARGEGAPQEPEKDGVYKVRMDRRNDKESASARPDLVPLAVA